MEDFIYHTPTKVYFGKNEEYQIGRLILAYHPKRVMVHFGQKSVKTSGLLNRVENYLSDAGLKYVELGGVKPNPELSLVREGIQFGQQQGVDFILAIGGGSVIDSAKAIAHGIANPDMDVWDYFLGKELPRYSLHKAAILTLAAAGSEMSNSCVITNAETMDKRGFGCEQNRLDFAIENPELTYSVPPFQTACGIVDITMHTIERYFCPGIDTPLTDGIAEAVIKNTLLAGTRCLQNPTDYEARATMMFASSLAHNGLTQCGRKTQLVVHQFEHEISGMYPQVAHAAGLAAIWPSWARYVCQHDVKRWLQYADRVWNVDIDYEHPERSIDNCITCQAQLYKSIGMPTSLQELGVKESDLEPLALRCSRNKTRSLLGPIPLDYSKILDIYRMAYSAR